MSQPIKLVIPARYASTRLPAKPLRLIAGKPLIQHVYEAALKTTLGEIIIATDDERIANTCKAFSANVCMTSSEHESGSDRLAEVVTQYNWSDDTIIINLQGDEPLTPASCLQQVADNLKAHPEASIATLATPLLDDEEYKNPNIVKVVRNSIGMALYFSRANIPFQRDNEQAISSFALRHLGIYAYRAKFLKDFASMEQSPIEILEKLEQLRAMWYGKLIHVDIAKELPGHGVDTEEDLQAIERLLS
jgi:3-deoxy-manno-octulosonate cytidylyltransferase (CMP-KDO synthetase)